MAEHLVDIDEEALQAARSELGTNTIKDTVNTALLLVGEGRRARVAEAMEHLAGADLDDRGSAWR